MEELSRQAPAEEERNEEIEEDSSESEQAAEEETSQQEGTEDNPVDVERKRASPQFRIIDSQRVTILLVRVFVIDALLDSSFGLANVEVRILGVVEEKPASESDGFRRRTRS